MDNPDIRSRIEKRIGGFKAGGDTGNVHIWMTVYSDMMTNLMLFFLMMFAMGMAGETHFQLASDSFKKSIAGQKFKDVQAVKAPTVKDFFREYKQTQKDVQVIEQGEGVRLRLPEPVLFDLGQAALKPAAALALHDIAKGLAKFPNMIVVEGHTDNLPIKHGPFKSNWELSEARAENVVNHLVQVEGIPPHRLAVAGFGEFWPFVPNETPEKRALNRRIDILVLIDEKK